MPRWIEGSLSSPVATWKVGGWLPRPFFLRRMKNTETIATASIAAAMEDARSNNDGSLGGGDVLLVGLLGDLITKLSANLLAPATV